MPLATSLIRVIEPRSSTNSVLVPDLNAAQSTKHIGIISRSAVSLPCRRRAGSVDFALCEVTT